jgi:hypothetical protein
VVRYLVALALTIGIEVPIVATFYPGQRRRMALACLVATTLTHLALHFGLTRFLSWNHALVSGEIVALVGEAAAYAWVARPRDIGRALVASALANGASFVAGLVVFR